MRALFHAIREKQSQNNIFFVKIVAKNYCVNQTLFVGVEGGLEDGHVVNAEGKFIFIGVRGKAQVRTQLVVYKRLVIKYHSDELQIETVFILTRE